MNSLQGIISIMTPLLFAATGGLFTELSGMLNIALEGLLLTGAFSAAAAYYYTGSFTAALFAAILASAVLACVLAFTTIRLRSNVFITGLAANLLAMGLTAVISQRFFGSRGVIVLREIQVLPEIHIPLLGAIPVYVCGSLLLLFLSALVIFKTPFGYHLRACEKHEEALASLGLRPGFYRFWAFIVSGICCGIGGSYLSLNLGAFVPNMSAGKGWIALVLIFLGGRRPHGLLAAAFIFGAAEVFSNYAQGRFNVPADFILAIPYLFTFLAMIAVSWLKDRKKTAKL